MKSIVRHRHRLVLTALLCAAAMAAPAAAEPLESVLITATRSDTAPADLPIATDVVTRGRIAAGQLQVNLSEVLGEVAGVSAQQRQNYAQDLQLSVRGFGARSSFGVRGVRLYTDGIPATLPDGQGQFSHFDLASAARVEVIRGPYSVLHGNAAGGVIALYTREPDVGTGWQASLAGGSIGTRRLGLEATHATAEASYLVDLGRFQTDGYRQHSAARRDTANARAHWHWGDRSTLTLVANVLDLPEAEDPLGLTRAQLAVDPRQAGSNAVAYDARKSVGQQQLGADYSFDPDPATRFELSVYGGRRTTRQFQAIPRTSEALATHPGGVIDLERRYRGIDARWHHAQPLAGGQLAWTAGLAADGLDEARRGFLNYAGATLGVIGALRRADANRVYDLDEYLQAQYDSGRWLWLAGVRHSDVRVRSRNELLASGSESAVAYAATNPVAGLTWRLGSGWRAYAAYGRGFETPTLNDLAYRSTDGSLPGLNLGLRPAISRHYEVGLKRAAGALQGSLALFQIDTRDELAVLASAGGRTVYQNIPATRRRGVELELTAPLGERYAAQLAYTQLEAVNRADYLTCAGLPCVATPVRVGARLAAVPGAAIGARLTAHLAAVSLTLESQWRTRMFVNDANSDAASGYALFNAHAEFSQRFGGWRLGEDLRLDNLLDRRYVGSVIVNESNGRYFEPEPGRTLYLIARLSHAEP